VNEIFVGFQFSAPVHLRVPATIFKAGASYSRAPQKCFASPIEWEKHIFSSFLLPIACCLLPVAYCLFSPESHKFTINLELLTS